MKQILCVCIVLMAMCSLQTQAQVYKTARISVDKNQTSAEFSTDKGLYIDLTSSEDAVVSTSDESHTVIAKMPLIDGAVMSIDLYQKNGIADSVWNDSIQIPISSAGYASYYSPFPVIVPGESYGKVYVPTLNDTGDSLILGKNLPVGTILPPYTGMIIAKGSLDYIGFTSVGKILGKFDGFAENDNQALSGSVVARPISYFENGGNLLYTLGRNSVTKEIGFYHFVPVNGNAGNVVAERAFLIVSQNSNAKIAFKFDDEDFVTTGINDMTDSDITDQNAYNVAGQRVKNNTKGIIIINGKKYVNR